MVKIKRERDGGGGGGGGTEKNKQQQHIFKRKECIRAGIKYNKVEDAHFRLNRWPLADRTVQEQLKQWLMRQPEWQRTKMEFKDIEGELDLLTPLLTSHASIILARSPASWSQKKSIHSESDAYAGESYIYSASGAGTAGTMDPYIRIYRSMVG